MGRAIYVNENTIALNSELLRFNKVWVVSTTGDDSVGDGSMGSPFASISRATSVASTGDAIYICNGEYRLAPINVDSPYRSVGIYDRDKGLTIIGESGTGVKLTYYGADGTNRDGIACWGTNTNFKLINLTYIFYPGKTANYSNAIFGWCRWEIRNVFFWIRGSRMASYTYYNNPPANSPRVYNCAFYHDQGAVYENYTGHAYYENCLWNVAPRVSSANDSRQTIVTCKTKSFDPNNIELLAEDPDLIDAGTGLDLDGSPADIGPYGGQYTWHEYSMGPAVDFYVSQQRGDDNNDGLSPESPVKTIAKAFSLFYRSLDPGDQHIFIGPGTYRENISVSLTGLDKDRRVIIQGDPDCNYITGDHPGIVRITGCNEDEQSSIDAPVVRFLGSSFVEIHNVYIDSTSTESPAVLGNNLDNILKNARVTSYSGIKNMECHNCHVISTNVGYEDCVCIQSIALGGQTGFKNSNTYNCMALGATNGYEGSIACNCLAVGCGGSGFIDTENHSSYALCCKQPTNTDLGDLKVSCSEGLNNAPISLLKSDFSFLHAPALINAGTESINEGEKIPVLKEDFAGSARSSGLIDIGPWEIPEYSYDWQNYIHTPPALRIDGAGDIIFKVPVKKGERVSKSVSVRSFVPDFGLENTFYVKENLQEGNLQNLEYTASGLKLLYTEYAGFRDMEYDLPELESIVFSKISWQEKAIQDGLYFDGVDDRVVIPHHSSIKPSQITVAVWAKKDDWTKNNPANGGRIISCEQSQGYGISVEQNGTIRFSVLAGGSYRTVSTQSELTSGLHFICGTYNGQHVRLYIDGELVAETAYSGSISYSYNNALMLGANPNATTGTDPGYFFEGYVKSVAIWNRALSQEEIVKYYHDEPEGNEEGLISYYKMDSYSGNVVNDLVGNNHGTIVGAIWKNIPPVKIETNFSRDGINWDGWVECQNGESIPGVLTGGSIKNGKLAIRQTFIPIQSVSPVLESVVITINGFSNSYGRPQLILRYHGEEAVATSKDSHKDWNSLSVGIVPQSTGVADLILRSTEPRKGFYCLFSDLR